MPVKKGILPRIPKLVVFDFDGVLTDNRVLVHQDGTESVFCHRGDGLGIARLKEQGIPMAVLSTEGNPVVSARCRKLGLPCYQGLPDKLVQLKSLATAQGLRPEDVVYVGNDENDLACMAWAGLGIAVKDADPSVISKAKIVLSEKGGQGAVREVCGMVLRTLEAEKPTEPSRMTRIHS